MRCRRDLLRAFKELLVEFEMDEFRLVMQRAVDQSEVRPDNPALEYVVHMMLGGFAIRTLIDELPPTQPSRNPGHPSGRYARAWWCARERLVIRGSSWRRRT